MTLPLPSDASRSAAAQAAAVVPFSCVICFEEFSLRNSRLPVILPCGHTFVCSDCAPRLKRCMECRQDLYLSVKSSSKHTIKQPLRRQQNTPLSQAPTSQAETIRYPMPKNLVLISLMEAAERQAKQEEDHLQYEEELDLQQIIGGLTGFLGASGTYAVKPEDGVELYRSLPTCSTTTTLQQEEEDVDSPTSPESTTSSSTRLARGEKLQVVSMVDGGYAKLARGEGYVEMDKIVKIGAPLEDVCKLEGILDTVRNRSHDFQRELRKSSQVEERLVAEIAKKSLESPNHPVIERLAISPPPPTNKQLEDSMNTGCCSSEDLDECAPLNIDRRITAPSTPLHRYSRPRSHSDIADVLRTPDSSSRANFLFPIDDLDELENGLPMDNFNLPTHHHHHVVVEAANHQNQVDCDELGYGCSALLGTNLHLFNPTVPEGRDDILPRRVTAAASSATTPSTTTTNHPTSSSSSASSTLVPRLTSSFDTIDFRTGLSGHRGLSHQKLHYSPTSPSLSRSRYMMSEHRGLGRVLRTAATNSP